jgi:hypothetical protein
MTGANQMSYFESSVKFHAEQNYATKMGNEFFEDVAKLKYLGII